MSGRVSWGDRSEGVSLELGGEAAGGEVGGGGGGGDGEGGDGEYDAFLSSHYRSRSSARQLLAALSARGLRVWADFEEPGRRGG